MGYRGRPTSSNPDDDQGQERLRKSLLVKAAQPIPRPKSGAYLRGAHSTAECQEALITLLHTGARSHPSLSYAEDTKKRRCRAPSPDKAENETLNPELFSLLAVFPLPRISYPKAERVDGSCCNAPNPFIDVKINGSKKASLC